MTGGVQVFGIAHVVKFLNAFIYQGWGRVLMGNGHPAAKQHLELLAKMVFQVGKLVRKLLLTRDLPSLSDGADDLGHLQRRDVSCEIDVKYPCLLKKEEKEEKNPSGKRDGESVKIATLDFCLLERFLNL